MRAGARVWTGFQNLPELNIENPAVRGYLYQDPDSVVRSYLREGADGWRLDTAFELGYQFLRELTQAAHEEMPGSLIVGEIVNYPDEWLRSIDAVMNLHCAKLCLARSMKASHLRLPGGCSTAWSAMPGLKPC